MTHESFWNSKFPRYWAFASSDSAWQGVDEAGSHSHHFPGRGHGIPDSRSEIALPSIGELDFPLGTLRALDGQLSRLHGSRAMEFVFERIYQNSQMVLRDAPIAVRSEGVEALIVDRAEFAGGKRC